MAYVIKQVDSEGSVSYYDGSEFSADLNLAYVSQSIEDARYLQGSFQSRFVNSEVTKEAVKTSVSLG